MKFTTRPGRRRAVATWAVASTVLVACGGGAGDIVGADAAGDADTTLILVAYAVAEPGWSNIVTAFAETPAGEGVAVRTSYGASSDQARAVADGKAADIVSFSIESDVTRLVEAGKVAPEWNSDVTGGVPFGSVVTLVVRKGNPRNIRDWDDLLAPGVEVVTPSPMSSGSAKWNLLAPYAVKSQGGRNRQAGLDFITALVNDHVRTRPVSGREATDVFLEGTGDVLISYENEAIHIERHGAGKGRFDVEHVNPPQTLKIDNPVAVVATSPHLDRAIALKNFLFTPQGQTVWAQAGFRPVDPAVAEDFANEFPAPERLWTVADLGGWSTVDPALFDRDNGAITTIYEKATG